MALRSWLRDPLTHFLVLGLGGLVVYEALGGGGGPGSGQEIVVTAARVEGLRAAWVAQWGRPPTAAELEGRIDSWVREEILYREALALGLDRDDTIVRRRLAQKMEFLAADAVPSDPSDAELSRFLGAHRDRFRSPMRLSFEQVYLSPDLRGEALETDAKAMLEGLRGGRDPAGVGDRLLLPLRHEDVSEERIAQVFGADFARVVRNQEAGRWEGPVPSGYGLHLVRVERREAPRDPPLSELRDRVLREWQAEQRDELLAAFRRELRARYAVRRE